MALIVAQAAVLMAGGPSWLVNSLGLLVAAATILAIAAVAIPLLRAQKR